MKMRGGSAPVYRYPLRGELRDIKRNARVSSLLSIFSLPKKIKSKNKIIDRNNKNVKNNHLFSFLFSPRMTIVFLILNEIISRKCVNIVRRSELNFFSNSLVGLQRINFAPSCNSTFIK